MIKKLFLSTLFAVNVLAGTIVDKTISEFTEANTTCPVRFIDVKQYPSYAAMIVYKDGKQEFYSSPKYMLRQYYQNQSTVDQAYVADFVSMKLLNVKNGYFVYGSNLMSVGGDDLIAFDSEEKAKIFSMKHKGKRVLPFSNVSKKLIEYLDMQ
ncbi:MAG: nitrous oxide reductase accessory protein NosL [Sulfuricurvum sp.]|nr:nitrous oxide reductase accessory protein NosL [Sulfuricurvum sp.]MDD5385829.1 nitrous oxide reductase accessory protein NosL [Sulfuricurvum sp.]